jgi:hypothetical protein
MFPQREAATMGLVSDEDRKPADAFGPIRGRKVTIFIVERRLPELSLDNLIVAHRALAESSRRISLGGDSVRYLRSTFTPAGGKCLCMFGALSLDLVRRVNEVAQVPFDRIDEAVHFEDPGGRYPPCGDTP